MSGCTRCLLPGAVPGADLSSEGVCSHCRGLHDGRGTGEERMRLEREADLEASLEACRGQGLYDCLVGLSGGKDSCYLLHKLVVEKRLKVLAFTVGGKVPDLAWENIRRTVRKLDVDHLVYTPPQDFSLRLFRHLLRNQEARGAVRTVCYVCAPLTEGYALQVATEKGIPLVLAGYSPGQPDPARMLYEFPRRMIEEADWIPPALRDCGAFGADDLARFWNPRRYPAGTRFPRFLAPFHAWEYNQEEVMKAVVKLGLIRSRRRASPVHTNCEMNWLLMYSDLVNLGYNPYAPEFARLIREGRASRRYWAVMQPLVNWMIRRRVLLGRNVTRQLTRLGLELEELRIAARPAAPGKAAPSSETAQAAC